MEPLARGHLFRRSLHEHGAERVRRHRQGVPQGGDRRPHHRLGRGLGRPVRRPPVRRDLRAPSLAVFLAASGPLPQRLG